MSNRSRHCKAEKRQRKAAKALKLQALQEQQQQQQQQESRPRQTTGPSVKRVKLANRGTHNCSWKDAGITHTLNEAQCLRKRHCGYCPICGVLSHYTLGCTRHRIHGAKKENLVFTRGAELDRLVAANRGVFGR